ncbi:MAG: radical SAM protein [Acidobacteria bacterium]|jgi:organic radical activating enzyme|nr:radical SAM protein [Acidobacteriota bacterium]
MSNKSQKSMSIVVTAKCPLRCRHCAVGIGGEPKSIPLPRLNEEDIKRAIQVASAADYKMINFVGGEPFLVPKLLVTGITECRTLGLQSLITTAPMWASNKEKALTYLAKVPALDYLILSYDHYHLEFLDIKHYENAVNAAFEKNIKVNFNICYSFPEDKERALEHIRPFSERILRIQFQSIVPIGNAKIVSKTIPLSGITIENLSDLDRLERSCSIGDIIIGLYKDVHACCWASALAGSPLRFDRDRSGDFSAALRVMEKDKCFQLFLEKGFLGGLAPGNMPIIFEAIKGKTFVNECHLCMFLMGKQNRDLWNKQIVPTS